MFLDGPPWIYQIHDVVFNNPGTLELYEGPTRFGEGRFSSLAAAPLPPEAARQSYVLPAPAPPTTLAATITDRGITAKDVLGELYS